MKLILATSAFVAGVGIGYFLVPEASLATASAAISAAVLFSVAATALAPRPRSILLVPVLVAAIAGGLIHGTNASSGAAALPDQLRTSSRVELEGVLSRDPRPYGDAFLLTLDVERFLADGRWRPAAFRTDVVAGQLTGAGAVGRAPDGFQPGDVYRVTGDLFGAGWSPAATRGSSAVVQRAEVTLVEAPRGGLRRSLASFRRKVNESIDRTSSEPAAGLTKAMITGNRGGLSPETRGAFRRSGTSHILAISGMHVGIFAAMATAVSVWIFGRRRQLYLIFPAAAVWGYAAMAAFSPPVTRAAIMASVYVVGRALGRQRSALPALGLAAAVMIGLDPSLMADVSFQLSFLAVAGVVIVTPTVERPGNRLLERWQARLPGYVVSAWRALNAGIAMSAGALSLTAPVVVLTFDAISVWGTPATLLQVPALPALIVFGGAQALLGMVWAPLAVMAGAPCWALSSYLIGVAEVFSDLPGGALRPTQPLMLFAGIYYVSLAAVLNRDRFGSLTDRFRALAALAGRLPQALPPRPILPRRAAPKFLVVTALGASALVWAGAVALPDAALQVTFFETDGGDSILIRTPSGRQVLIDGGDSSLGAVRALSRRMPFWDRSIDLVVLTHPHADHARGLLAVLERYDVYAILDSPSTYESTVYADWQEAAGREGAVRLPAVSGSVLNLDHDLRVEVLLAQPEDLAPDPNDRSIVMRLDYGAVSFLFTGDLSSLAEERLLRSGAYVRASVLKVGHQGSRGSSSEAFLAAVGPSIAVVPASIGNKFGHPHQEAIERISRTVASDQILITKDRGTVDIETDGRAFRVRTQR